MANPLRVSYDKKQLEQYFDRICLPKPKRLFSVSELSDEKKLAYLELLQHHQQVKIPFENLSLHYSWHRTVTVKPLLLHRKIAEGENNHRGGWCMEVNCLFHTVIYSLGYDCWMAGARIYSTVAKRYGGWTHCVNIVRIGGKAMFLDGGLGSLGPIGAIPLEDGKTVSHISPARSRIVYEALPEFLNKESKVWIYQHQFDDDAEWKPVYCFTDQEFTPRDLEDMNFSPSKNPRTFFTQTIVCFRFSTTAESSDRPESPGSPVAEAITGHEINGTIAINQDTLKWRRNGKRVVDIKFQSDSNRLDALKKYFGIVLDPLEAEAIKGTTADIVQTRV